MKRRRIAAAAVVIGFIAIGAWATPAAYSPDRPASPAAVAPLGGQDDSDNRPGPVAQAANQPVAFVQDQRRGDSSNDGGFENPGRSSGYYCVALRKGLNASERALNLSGRDLRTARQDTSKFYRQAAIRAGSAEVRAEMLAVARVYDALVANDLARAATASQQRFAAVPAAAPKVRNDCGVDLFHPVDYRFTIIQHA